MKAQTGKTVYLALATIVIWFALCLQFNISLQLLNGNVPAALKIFLSFFTVTTNILAALCFFSLWLFEHSAFGRFFSKPGVQTAIAVYILVVGLIYNVALRGLLHPVGWARTADELLHVADPLIFLLFWILYTDKSNLRYKSAIIWLIYPMCYVVFIIIRGAIIHQYPYPFIDVVKLGYPMAILNTVIILIVFWLLSLFFIFLGKKFSQKN